MTTITFLHYVPKPGGGLASPGESWGPDEAARFSEEQLQRLMRMGAIQVYITPDPVAARMVEPEAAPKPEHVEAQPQDEAPEMPADAPEAEEASEDMEEFDDGAEPPEIDIMDGIVRDAPAPAHDEYEKPAEMAEKPAETAAKLPKKQATTGRRKAK